MQIGKRLMHLRRKNELSLEQAANGIVSPTHLSNIENGRYYPSEDILRHLAKKYKVPDDYFINFDKSDPTLDQHLYQLFLHVTTNKHEKAEQIINLILKDGPIINIEQEAIYLLLKTAWLIQQKKPYEHYLKYFISMDKEISYPSFLHQCYNYLMSLVYFENKDYHACYEAAQISLRYDLPSNVKPLMEFNLLLVLYYLNEPIKAIKQAEETLKDLYLNHLWDYVSETFLILTAIYYKFQDYEKALDYTKKAYEIANTFGNEKIKGRVYHNYGITYKGMKNYDLAIEYLKKSIQIKEQFHLSTQKSYWSLLDLYVELKDEKSFNDIYDKLNFFDEEIEYLKVMLNPSLIPEYVQQLVGWAKTLEERERLFSSCRIYHLLSDYYYEDRKYKLSANYYQKVLEIIRKSKGQVYI